MADGSARVTKSNEEIIIEGYERGLYSFAPEGRLKHIENLTRELERLHSNMPGLKQVHTALTEVRTNDPDQRVKSAALMLQIEIAQVRPDLQVPLIYEQENSAA